MASDFGNHTSSRQRAITWKCLQNHKIQNKNKYNLKFNSYHSISKRFQSKNNQQRAPIKTIKHLSFCSFLWVPIRGKPISSRYGNGKAKWNLNSESECERHFDQWWITIEIFVIRKESRSRQTTFLPPVITVNRSYTICKVHYLQWFCVCNAVETTAKKIP